MASLVARTAHTSQPCSSAVARIWKTVRRSLSFSALRSHSREGLDGRVPPYPEASSAAHLSRESPPAVSTTQSFRADRPVYHRTAFPARTCGGYGIRNPSALLEFRRTRTRAAFNGAKSPVSNPVSNRASRNVAQESSRDAPRQGFVCSPEVPFGSACATGNVHLSNASNASEAIAILKHLRQQGLSIDSYMFTEILKRCSMQKDLTATRQVHDYIIQSGMQKHQYVGNTLLTAYIKCGRLQDAHRVFDGLERTSRTTITWNGMISAYAKSGCGTEAYRLFQQMKREGFTPNAITYLSILNAAASAGALEWVKEVHSHARKAGLESNLRVGGALIHMYAKSGSIDDARQVFDRMEKRDVFSWNIIIGAYAENGCGAEAHRLFLQMKQEGFKPDAYTYASILNASASVGDARLVFDSMKKRNTVTWNIMIGAYAESGRGMEAYRLFLQMEREGFTPDALTYLNLLNASASAGALEWVKEVHNHSREAGLDSDLRVGNALIHMFAKSGSVDDARLVFDSMEKRDVITWNAMIGGLALHGYGDEALKLFKTMIADCVKPNETSFVAVLSACCHAGLVDDGRRLFLAMVEDYGIEPTVVHHTCMVDLLGRAGHLEEAKLLIDNMAVKPNAVTWKALLGACRTYRDVQLGECAATEILKLEPKNSAAYVLLSNIYAAVGEWEKVSSVRTIMQKRGVRKEPGRSWIGVDNKIHEFVVGDTSHPEATAIYRVLQELTEKLKAKGYNPDTRLVLHDIDEDDKELALCSHSEKLAIAYGLLRVPRGKPIRVEKNLRICSDCHAATKLISEVTGREIIAKDASRFHHFKDGVCSCGDYW